MSTQGAPRETGEALSDTMITWAIAELKRSGLWKGFIESHKAELDELRDIMIARHGEEVFREMMERPDELN
jgi:hypothetical protein